MVLSMNELVERFPQQLLIAGKISLSGTINKPKNPLSNVVITGLGGSGIGGSIVSEVVSASASCPILINKDYFLPAFVNSSTLVIVCSYSGNTEETLSALREALQKKAIIVVITSGGEALRLAEEYQLPHFIIPKGMPPRSCLGYSMVQLLKSLSLYDIIHSDYVKETDDITTFLLKEQDAIKSQAGEVAKEIVNQLPVIYSLGNTEGVAIRFRQQLNENSKVLCWHHIIPEMNHNELVGWTESHADKTVILLRFDKDYERNIKRLEVCLPVLKKYAAGIIELNARGNSHLAQVYYMIHLCDWISCYLADIRKVDSMEINIINHLKSELSKA
jgi:glucose/mannose-6-phosphate isomerase